MTTKQYIDKRDELNDLIRKAFELSKQLKEASLQSAQTLENYLDVIRDDDSMSNEDIDSTEQLFIEERTQTKEVSRLASMLQSCKFQCFRVSVPSHLNEEYEED